MEVLNLTFDGIRIRSTGENLGGFYSICFMGSYDPVLSRLDSSDVVVDGGANIGVFAILASSRSRRVYAVEPNPENFAQLCENLQLNRCGNVTPVNAALSDRAGSAFIIGHGEESRLSNHGRPIPTVTIDSVTAGEATCIKLDVEGATMLAMRGISDLTKVHTICFEVEMDQHDSLARELTPLGVDPGSYQVLTQTLLREGFSMSSFNRGGVGLRQLLSLDLLRSELSTKGFALRAAVNLLLHSSKNLFYAPSLTDERIDTLYFTRPRPRAIG